jgi:preprotein translocase subunit SecE
VTQIHTDDASGDKRASSGRATRVSGGAGERPGVFARLALFLRQVVAELKKVVRPTRNELITYTSVVLVFVLVVMLFVSGLDFAFGKLVLWAFGGGD